jgi:hypothetical protein
VLYVDQQSAARADELAARMAMISVPDAYINDAHRRITQHVALDLSALLSIVTRLTEPIGPKNFRMRPIPGPAET